MEAIILAGGKAERLGAAAEGRPKALVPIAGRPLAAYQVAQLARAGVTAVLVSCAAGQEDAFEEELSGLGPEIVTVPEPEPLGRGGGLRLAAGARREEGDVYALNGDELLDVDLGGAARAAPRAGGARRRSSSRTRARPSASSSSTATSSRASRRRASLPHWVSCGVYVLGEEAIAGLPERGDHEATTFPALATRRRLAAFRHAGLWLTVNTPKDLRVADEHVRSQPGMA